MAPELWPMLDSRHPAEKYSGFSSYDLYLVKGTVSLALLPLFVK